jgi:hypothetical protein
MKKSRRMIVAATLVAAVGAFVVAEALAASTTWKGNGTDDPVLTVKFKRVKTHGHPAKIKDLDIQRLHFTCTANTGVDPFRSGLSRSGAIATVHGGEFSYSATTSSPSGNIKYNTSFKGEFVSGRTATGTIRQKRSLASDPTQYCISKTEPWKVHKQ